MIPSPLSTLVLYGLYLLVGASEWSLCVVRTRAIALNHVRTAVVIVFIENALSLWVLSNFVRSNDFGLAFAYCLGGSIGAYTVCKSSAGNKTNDK